jgi:hypothetical protein
MKKRIKKNSLNLKVVEEIVSKIRTETEEVIITKTSKMITKGTMKMDKLDREVEEVVEEVIEVAEEAKRVIIKPKNIIMKIDQSTKTKKSTRKNQIGRCLMIQTTQVKKRKKMEKEIHIKEREAVVVNK